MTDAVWPGCEVWTPATPTAAAPSQKLLVRRPAGVGVASLDCQCVYTPTVFNPKCSYRDWFALARGFEVHGQAGGIGSTAACARRSCAPLPCPWQSQSVASRKRMQNSENDSVLKIETESRPRTQRRLTVRTVGCTCRRV